MHSDRTWWHLCWQEWKYLLCALKFDSPISVAKAFAKNRFPLPGGPAIQIDLGFCMLSGPIPSIQLRKIPLTSPIQCIGSLFEVNVKLTRPKICSQSLTDRYSFATHKHNSWCRQYNRLVVFAHSWRSLQLLAFHRKPFRPNAHRNGHQQTFFFLRALAS